jgi:hypothetical protein
MLLLFLLAVVSNAHATATTTLLKIGLQTAPTVAVTSEPAGTNVTVTATVTAAVAGNVAFTYGTSAGTTTTPLASCSAVLVSSATATCTTTTLPLGGPYYLEAVFTPTTAGYVASSAISATAAAYTVTAASTTTTLSATVNGASFTSGSSTAEGSVVILSLAVAPVSPATGTPTGTVTYNLTGSPIAGCTAVALSATCAVSFLAVSTAGNSLTATYTSGSTSYTSSTSPAFLVKVIAGATPGISLTTTPASPGTVATASGLSLSATVSVTGSTAATGFVTFYDNSTTVLGTSTLVAGTTTGTTTKTTTATATLAGGSFTGSLVPGPSGNVITAKYFGNLADNASAVSSASTITLLTPTSITLLRVSAATATFYYGESLLLTASVSPTAANGTVDFYDAGILIGTGTASAGTATFNTSTSLALGGHTFTAKYVADTVYAVSLATATSPTTTSVVFTPTSVGVAASGPSTISQGTGFTLTATVTPKAGTAIVNAGSVTFYDSSTLLGKVTVNSSGVATLASTSFPSAPAAGKHYYIASYGGVYNGGSAEFSTSISSSAPVIVNNSQTITFAGPASPVTYGAATAALSATSTSSLTVAFTASGACSVNGTTLTYLSAGTCTINANQRGNSSWTAATQVTRTVTVSPASLLITASSPASITYGSPIPTITASYGAFANSDTKWTGLTTRPTCTTAYSTSSAPGPYTTSCSGAVGANYSISYATGSFSVTKASQTLSHWFNSTTTYGTPVTLSAVASSGLSISYTVVSGPGTMTSATTLTPSGIGTITVAANVAGNTDYTVATQVEKTVTVYPAPLVITASNPASIVYGQSAPAVTPGYATVNATFVNGNTSASLTHGPTCFVPSYTTSSAPGTYPTVCYGAVDPNYDITYVAGSLSVGKAPAIIGTQPTSSGAFTYGTELGTNTNLVQGTANVLGVFTWTYPTNVPSLKAGGTTQSVTFTPTSSTNYSSATTTVTVTVNKATPTIASKPIASATTYGSALSTSNLSGGSTNAIGGGVFTWTSGTPILTTIGANAGEGVTFTANDAADYNTATTTVSVTVNKATPSITWPTASAITYGLALSSSSFTGGSALQTDGVTSLPGTFTWTSSGTVPTSGGSNSESVTFTPSSSPTNFQTDYATTNHNISITVTPLTATITACPFASAITVPQTLISSTLLGGSASVAGSFAWTTPSTQPDAGAADSESVTFTPTNLTKYGTATCNTNVLVNQAATTVSGWPTASAILAGQTLASSTLNQGSGSASQAGTFVWTNSSTTPAVGTASYGVTFNPTDTNYASVSTGTASVIVNACGMQDSVNLAFSTAMQIYVATGAPTTLVDPSLDAEGTNVSALCAVTGAPADGTAVTVTFPTIISNAASSNTADTLSNGLNAAVLAYGTNNTAGAGATITINDDGSGDPSFIATTGNYSSAVFASLGGTVAITDAGISTAGNYAYGFDATYGGTLTLNNVTATTSGNNSAAIMSGVGGANQVSSTGGAYTTNGTNAAGVYAAGNGSTVSLSGDTVTANNWTAVVVEGGNTVTSTGNTSLTGALGNNHDIFFFEGSSEDAAAGTGIFTMTNGSIAYNCDASLVTSCANGATTSNQNALATLFAVANTTATITLTDVAVTNNTNSATNGILLTAAALNSGTVDLNGGNATLTAYGETLVGDVIVDPISTVNLSLKADGSSTPTTLTGAINTANSGAATVSLTIDATSSWVAGNGPSYLTALTGAGAANVSCQTYQLCSVYVGGVLQTSIQ